MKKFTIFLMAGLMVFMASASAQQARIILNSYTNYEVQVDNRTYNSPGNYTITDLSYGSHTVAVYQVVSNGVFGIGKKRNLLSSENFNFSNNDVIIDVSENGQLRISRDGYYGNNDTGKNGTYGNNNRNQDGTYGTNTRDRNGSYGNNNNRDRKDNYGTGESCNDKGRYGRSEGKGNGNRYGQYKNKNQQSHAKNNQRTYGNSNVRNDRWGN